MSGKDKGKALRKAVDAGVKDKYLDRLEEFINTAEDKMGEAQKVVDVNQAVLDIVLDSDRVEEPLVKEAIESFNMVIDMTKKQHATTSMKRDSAIRLKKIIEKNEVMEVAQFMTDFDKIAGV